MIDPDGFRPNVAIVLMNDQRRVFWAQRANNDGWQFPQGGMRTDETPVEAMYRELEEETGLRPEHVELIGSTPGWLRYRLPRRYQRHYSKPLCIGQKQVWFLLRFLGDDTAFSLFKEYGLGPGPDVLVVRKEFAEKYPNTSRAFVKGYFEAVEMLIKQPEECAKVLVKLTNLSMEEQMAVLKDITWIPGSEQKALMVNPGKFVEGMQKLADFLVKQKQIDSAPNVKEWIDVSLVP